MSVITNILDFIDERAIVRRVMLFWVAVLTTQAFSWTLQFAAASPRAGLEVAAIIAAVWAPLAALQGAVFSMYSSSRNPTSG